MLLTEVKKSIRDKFDRFTQHNGAFDYLGMERGGHNAFLEWLLKRNTTGKVAHVVQAHSRRPGLDMHHPSKWFTTAWPDPTLTAISYGPDTDISTYLSRIEGRKVVSIVRDVRNMIASRIKGSETGVANFMIDSGMVEKWKRMTRQLLGEVDYCDGECVSVSYDQWCCCEKYREAVVGKMNDKWGWELSMEGEGEDREKVSPKGGGSSWDRMEKQHHASEMKVTERWREYEDHPLMKGLLTPEVLELNARLIA